MDIGLKMFVLLWCPKFLSCGCILPKKTTLYPSDLVTSYFVFLSKTFRVSESFSLVRIWPRPRPEVSLWERKARLHLAARRHVCRPEGDCSCEEEWELCLADQPRETCALRVSAGSAIASWPDMPRKRQAAGEGKCSRKLPHTASCFRPSGNQAAPFPSEFPSRLRCVVQAVLLHNESQEVT